jgi:putative redox protein
MKAVLNWKGRMTFEGGGDSDHSLLVDADGSVGGDDSAPRPMELILLGLAGCTAMDVISILQKKKQPVKDFTVRIDAERAEGHPKVITEAVIEYRLTGRGVDQGAVVRAIGLSAEKYCPAQAMLGKAFPMKLVYTLIDDDGATTLKTGEYLPAVQDR